MSIQEMEGEKSKGQKLKVFLAGPIHGYEKRQNYRLKIRRLLGDSNISFFDAWEEEGRRNSFANRNWQTSAYHRAATRLREKRLAQIDDSDIIIAYISKESFGTACELSRGNDKGKKIILICPMKNPSPWIISITKPELLFKSMKQVEAAIKNSTLGITLGEESTAT